MDFDLSLVRFLIVGQLNNKNSVPVITLKKNFFIAVSNYISYKTFK